MITPFKNDPLPVVRVDKDLPFYLKIKGGLDVPNQSKLPRDLPPSPCENCFRRSECKENLESCDRLNAWFRAVWPVVCGEARRAITRRE